MRHARCMSPISRTESANMLIEAGDLIGDYEVEIEAEAFADGRA